MASAGGPGAARPPRPDLGSQMIMLLSFMLALFVMFDQGLRQGLGEIVGYGLTPVVGFNGSQPILTLMFTGLLMSFFSIAVRHFFIDWVDQARTQRITSAFQKEMRDARKDNNTYKLKKLMDMQADIMSKSLKSSQTQLKLMPVTMLVIIPIFAWLANFVYLDIASTSLSVPWEDNASLKGTNVLPNWILLYSLVTLPFGQALTRVLKFFSFTRRLHKLERGELEGDREKPEGAAQ